MKASLFLLLSNFSYGDDSDSFSSVAEKVKRAQENWKQAKLRTDESLAKVNDKLAKMSKELVKEKQMEADDLALLEKNRLAEINQLNLLSENLNNVTHSNTGVSLLQSSSLVSSEEDKSFNNDDVLLPLRKAAEAAKKFAADVKLQAMKLKARHSSSGSFVQNGNTLDVDDSSEWDKAREDMKEFNSELEKDRIAMLNEEEVLKGKDLSYFENAGKSSFVQGSDSNTHGMSKEEFDNILTPESLMRFREKFDAKMKEAYEIAHKAAPFPNKISFAEKDDSLSSTDFSIQNYAKEQEKIKKEQTHVEELQKQFSDGMEKLQASTSDLIKHSQEQARKYHDLKVRADAGKIKLSDNIDIFDTKPTASFAQKDDIVEANNSTSIEAGIAEGRKFFKKDTDEKIKEINSRLQEMKDTIDKDTKRETEELQKKNQKIVEVLNDRKETDKTFNSIKAKLTIDINKINKDIEKGKLNEKKAEHLLLNGH